jgi:uncharacterized membrane-anchored protein
MSTPQTVERPWPVVLLTAFGAWLAAIPLLLAVGLMLGDVITRGAGPYVVGVLVLAVAAVVLRAAGVVLFVEQLAIPALLVGFGTLSMGVFRDFPNAGGAAVMLGVVCSMAVLLPQAWLRALLGMVAAGLLAAVLLPSIDDFQGRSALLLVLHAVLLVWLLAMGFLHRNRTTSSAPAAVSAVLEPMGAGWVLTLLAGLVWVAGKTFLVGGAVGSNEIGEVLGWIDGWEHHRATAIALQCASVVLVVVGTILGARTWPALQHTLALAVAVVVGALAWCMPMLGATWLVLMVCVLTHRWRLAAAAALAASWIMGSFYYQLYWPLADKALFLLAAGAALGALVWWSQRARVAATSEAAPSSAADAHTITWRSASSLCVLATTLLTLLVANGAIWQKEDLIARGQRLYLPLLPMDPRSLMQGDYMALRFGGLEAQTLPLLRDLAGERPHLVVHRDERGIGNIVRTQQANTPLAANELLLELTPKNGRWVVVSDGWFFKEGDGPRWQAARYGEFRVLPNGRALLVGMADANLQTIEPQ